MMRAISRANSSGGIGLWFPCPSRYDANEFLSALSDNLANEVERRYVRNSSLMLALRRGQTLLIYLIMIPAAIAVATFAVHDFAAPTRSTAPPKISAALPNWLWYLAVASLGILVILYAIGFARDRSKRGGLVREAAALRERIRFTAALKSGRELEMRMTRLVPATIKTSQEKRLDERPTTIASLIFDFRNLAERIADTLPGPLIIGIDELDKIDSTDSVRELLRDIKGIFEVPGVHFLVSISEEAATTLQLGMFQSSGRDEFNSSFYTVIEVPPLNPIEAAALLQARGFSGPTRLSAALCLLSGGNRRELIRMADMCTAHASREGVAVDVDAIMMLLERESQALLNDLIRRFNKDNSSVELIDEIKSRAWTALPRDAFTSRERFTKLGRAAINDQWALPYGPFPEWFDAREAWRLFFVRLFVSAKLLTSLQELTGETAEHRMLIDLRNVLLMATSDASIAKLMLFRRFGDDLAGQYQA
jgi:hypothetical protein